MKILHYQDLVNLYGGTGDETDWVEDTKAAIRNAARFTRGFINGLLGYEDCNCN